MNRKENIFLWQDLGLVGFMAVMFASGVTMYCAESNEKMEVLVMFLIMFIPIVLSGLKIRGLAYAFTGVQILIYSLYKIYMYYEYRTPFTVVACAWAMIPVIAVLMMSLFISASVKMEAVNEFLSRQVEEHVMIDDVTGLYNRRSLLNDLSRSMAYAARNGLNITLIVIRLKYADELKRILTADQFMELRRLAANCVMDALRIEDRIYEIDDDGTIAAILTCDKAGADVVERRIRGIFSSRNTFDSIIGRELRVELKVGCLEYNREVHNNAITFLNQTENELQYDV